MSEFDNRYKEFTKRIKRLQSSVSFDTYKESVIQKIIDYANQNPNADLKELKKEISQIFGVPYESFSNELFMRYDDIIEVTNRLYYDLGVDLTRDHQKIQAIEKINATRLGSYEKKWVKKLSKVTRKALFEKVDYYELRHRIKKVGGGVSDYANVLAATQIKGYAREVKHQKANIGEVYWYKYMGNIRETTRDFCREKVGNHFHIDEIRAMDNDPRQEKQLKPVITYCGGWNCRHDWEPNPFYKPPKD